MKKSNFKLREEFEAWFLETQRWSAHNHRQYNLWEEDPEKIDLCEYSHPFISGAWEVWKELHEKKIYQD